jgi:magnesium transporter
MLATPSPGSKGRGARRFAGMDVLTAVDAERMAEWRQHDEFFWLDLTTPEEVDLKALESLLGLHPMALEDTREFGQRPKADAYQDHVLLVFYTARRADEGEERLIEPVEVHIYVSGHWIVTVRRRPCTLLDRLHDTLVPESTREEDYLVYRILDGLTDAFYPVIGVLEDRIDGLEAEVLERPRREQLRGIYRTKQEVHELQRLIAGQRDQFQTASHAILTLAELSRGTREYLRDIGDHLQQIGGELQRQNDDLLALTATYYNATTEKVNRTATRLSVIATFFVVWTLVTGFFGQNFQWLVDNVESRSDFLVFGVGGFLVPTVALAAVLWIKRHDWF